MAGDENTAVLDWDLKSWTGARTRGRPRDPSVPPWLDDEERLRYLQRRAHLSRKYGLTPDEYANMLDEQEGCCAICRIPADDERALDVDHDHRTGKVRGLLCRRCNNLLGRYGDDFQSLLDAANYLMQHL